MGGLIDLARGPFTGPRVHSRSLKCRRALRPGPDGSDGASGIHDSIGQRKPGARGRVTPFGSTSILARRSRWRSESDGDEVAAARAGRLERPPARGGGFGRVDSTLLASDSLIRAASRRDHRFLRSTTEWRLDAWSQWSPLALPAGWLLSPCFAKRLQQLALRCGPSMWHWAWKAASSRSGARRPATWCRVGCEHSDRRARSSTADGTDRRSYRTQLAEHPRHVSVAQWQRDGFLRPSVDPTGALILTSSISRFGDDGAYLIVHTGGGMAAVRRIPLAEQFRVYDDDEGTLTH